MSDRLAHAVGPLTRLTCLELDSLGLFLSVHDCYAHLRGVARLRRLRLGVDVDSVGFAVDAEDGAAVGLARQAFVRLLPSFNQLVDISHSCHECGDGGAHISRPVFTTHVAWRSARSDGMRRR